MEEAKENFIIFSDESGHWNYKEEEFYVRCWLKIKHSDFYYLSGYWKENKLDFPTEKTIKKSLNEVIKTKVPIQLFFTFSNIEEFRKRKFGPRDYLTDILIKAFTNLENRLKNGARSKLQTRFESDINYIFFLYTYENWHIRNFFEKLCNISEKYEFYFNKPQFLENDYKDIFNDSYKAHFNKESETDIKFVKNSEKSLGIAFADSFSSLFNKLLKYIKDGDEIQKLEENIKVLKQILYNSPEGNIGIKGINKVFFPATAYRIQGLIELENKLIFQLKNLLGEENYATKNLSGKRNR